MTTIYVPRLIESAEQAEALPAFTVARYIDGDTRAAIKTIDGIWESIPGFYGEEAHFSEDMTGWTALVPIEAEEARVVTLAGSTNKPHLYVEVETDLPIQSVHLDDKLLVTPWEEA